MRLHGNTCASKKGLRCNCPTAVFLPTTPMQLLAEAISMARKPGEPIEHNCPAGIITQVDFAQGRSLTHDAILAYGEQGMLQIAFLNHGINAPYDFIIQAWQEGWRYRADKGFFKEK
ncbi:MAG: hypothetical protein V4498_00585 [candidate division FCPU426 bacterium]